MLSHILRPRSIPVAGYDISSVPFLVFYLISMKFESVLRLYIYVAGSFFEPSAYFFASFRPAETALFLRAVLIFF